MALTDTFVRQVKHKGAEIGERYADGGGMYLRVKGAGKYWRLDYRIDGKAKTLGLGVYPDVSLLQPNRLSLWLRLPIPERRKVLFPAS